MLICVRSADVELVPKKKVYNYQQINRPGNVF
jgi:hypothetical protein